MYQEREREKYLNHVTGNNFVLLWVFSCPWKRNKPDCRFFFHPALFLSPFPLSVILPGRTRQHREPAINFSRTKRTKFKKVPASMSRVTRATDNINEPILATTTSSQRARDLPTLETREGVLSFRNFHLPCFMRGLGQIMGNPTGHRKSSLAAPFFFSP